MEKIVRWKQRFSNFEQAFFQLKAATKIMLNSDLERSGFIKTFEFTFELAWKTLKDFLESEGFSVQSPRKTIQQAFQSGYIENGHVWIDALEKRNLLAHTYSKELSQQACDLISNDYYSVLDVFYRSFKDKT